jgi:hypothetical protein
MASGFSKCCTSQPIIQTVETTREEVVRLRDLVIRRHGVWPHAVFSVDYRVSKKWLFVTYGLTKAEDKIEVENELVDAIAEHLWRVGRRAAGSSSTTLARSRAHAVATYDSRDSGYRSRS